VGKKAKEALPVAPLSDLLDIEGLLSAHSDLDLRRVRRWVRVFADALETPELYDDLQQRLRRRPRRKRDQGNA
jgi:hypothetical protein